MVSVIPNNDEREHIHDSYCFCEPRVDYRDPDTGEEYPHGPLMIHHAADGREAVEIGIGEMLAPDRNWTVWESE